MVICFWSKIRFDKLLTVAVTEAGYLNVLVQFCYCSVTIVLILVGHLLMFFLIFYCSNRTGRTLKALVPASLLVLTWVLIGLVSGSMWTLPHLFML